MRSLRVVPVLLLVTSFARAQDGPSQPDLPKVALEPTTAPTTGLAQAVATSLARNPSAIVAMQEIPQSRVPRRADSLQLSPHGLW